VSHDDGEMAASNPVPLWGRMPALATPSALACPVIAKESQGMNPRWEERWDFVGTATLRGEFRSKDSETGPGSVGLLLSKCEDCIQLRRKRLSEITSA
jgi:hypothetical protein